MQIERNNLPVHVGIIMDGNGRWAERRGLPRNAGHKVGAEIFRKISRHAARQGIRYLTVYAFSTENWKRSPEEVGGIMNLMRSYLRNTEQYLKENMCVRFLGERDVLDEDIRFRMDDLERRSRGNTNLNLNIAINYGGRGEILRAARALARRYADGEVEDLRAFGEADFGELLYTAGQPDVDLVIRTGGEVRISNFLPWQCAYAEYCFTDVLWPDFTKDHFDAAVAQFAARDRRIGGVSAGLCE